MQVALFVPCYIDQFFPQVAEATVALLERHGVEVVFPEQQTCCGQPLANTGLFDETVPLAERFADVFDGFDYVVCPSGSCTSMVRFHYRDVLPAERFDEKMRRVTERTLDLCEFLVDVLGVERVESRFPYRVGLHQSCHGLRELRLGPDSERVEQRPHKIRKLLETVEGIQLVPLERPDECCGFGGTFAVTEEAVSCMMGRDRIADHRNAGAQVIVAGDMSCLMHLDGLIRRDGVPLRVKHVAEVLAGEPWTTL